MTAVIFHSSNGADQIVIKSDKNGTNIDSRIRSLLQKAVRRGNAELIYTISAWIQDLNIREKNWFRNRTAIIIFEECWPLGQDLIFNRQFHSKVAVLIKAARSIKNRDAAGLGYLAYQLYHGDTSMLSDTPDDRHIKIVSHAISRPDDYWNWVEQMLPETYGKPLCTNAMKFKSVGRPIDRAVIYAAAYLSLNAPSRFTEASSSAGRKEPFPFWVALDRHTPQGRRVLKDVARDLHIDLKQLEWSLFYFEGCVTNDEVKSYWWDRYCHWQFNKLGLPYEEAHLLWGPVKPQVLDALRQDSRQLQREIYSWKLDNRENIKALKKAVELFITNFESGQIDQLNLFRNSDQ
jgi:hypothetical protein